jgi:hypothetical protein
MYCIELDFQRVPLNVFVSNLAQLSLIPSLLTLSYLSPGAFLLLRLVSPPFATRLFGIVNDMALAFNGSDGAIPVRTQQQPALGNDDTHSYRLSFFSHDAYLKANNQLI